MEELCNANQIKAIFIDFLLNQEKGSIIGSEIMFAYKKLLADLILLNKGNIIAYEIKAQHDDFRKIEYQLAEYNKVFDYVSLITTEKHFLKAKKCIPSQNGIIVISRELDIEKYREPKLNSYIRKEELLNTMTIRFIQEYFKLPRNNLDAIKVRKLAQNKELAEIKTALYSFLYKRISVRFSNFILEKGEITHYEDIALLSMPNKKIIL